MLTDVKVGVRGLLRAPAVFVAGTLCLALGIGANAALLGVLDLLLLRPPAHVVAPESVKRLYYQEPHDGAPQGVLSYPMYADLAGSVEAFAATAAVARFEASLGRGPGARKVRVAAVTPSFFPLLGVQPARGRLFADDEGRPSQAPDIALVAWEFWQRSLGGAPDVLGRVLPVEGRGYTVVGVLPPRFTGVTLHPVDVWLPIGAAGALGAGPRWFEDRHQFFLAAVARLRLGVSPEQAAGEATLRHRGAYAGLGDPGAARRVVSLRSVQRGREPEGAPVARLAAWLAASSGAVLLIACVGVASLLLFRGLERRQELAVRRALGASRWRLTRLLLIEGFLLAALGGLAACAMVLAGGPAIQGLLAPEAGERAVTLDLRLLLIVGLVSLVAAVLSGCGVALRRREEALAATLQARATRPGRQWMRAVLLAAEVGLTLALLVAAALFLRSLQNVWALPLGLDQDRVLVVTANLHRTGLTAAEADAFHETALARVRGLPGVERASVATGIPFRSSFGTSVLLPGRGDVRDLPAGGLYWQAVTEDYFATLGMPLLRGRGVTARDGAGAERVAVVNATMARSLWPDEEPLGRCFHVLEPAAPCVTVVGVVGDARRSALREPATAQFYLPLRQAAGETPSRALFVRAAGDPTALAAAVRREVQGVSAGAPYVEVRPLAELLDPQVRPWRIGATFLSLFGLVALAVAATGTFALVAHSVASRTQELGIRLALGARLGHLVWSVAGLGVASTATGVALGCVLAALLGPLVEPLLFDVSARDPAAALAAAATLLLAALAAGLLPALRLRSLDPAAAMRAL